MEQYHNYGWIDGPKASEIEGAIKAAGMAALPVEVSPV
jgi:hypothetical protein